MRCDMQPGTCGGTYYVYMDVIAHTYIYIQIIYVLLTVCVQCNVMRGVM